MARGSRASVEAFTREIHEENERAGIPVTDVSQQGTDEPKPRPSTFSEVPTDDWSDIGRKLDEVLRNIKDDAAAISADP